MCLPHGESSTLLVATTSLCLLAVSSVFANKVVGKVELAVARVTRSSIWGHLGVSSVRRTIPHVRRVANMILGAYLDSEKFSR